MPTPSGVGVTLSEETFTVTWNSVTGASHYDVEHQVDGSAEEWTSVGTTTTTTLSHVPDGGVACGSSYGFRVRSYGDASTYAAGWSVASGVQSVATAECNSPPEFATSTYSFSVAEDAAMGSAVGTVSATDPDEGDVVSYSIASGDAGKFAVVTSTGAAAWRQRLWRSQSPTCWRSRRRLRT